MAALILKLYCFFQILTPLLTWRPRIFNERDNMGVHEKQKMILLSDELFKESLLKLRQIIDIRHDHENTIPYAVGMIMGRIREKYRYMLETYRDIVHSYHNYTIAHPPGVRFYRTFHFIIALEMMHYLELEIDKLVDVLLEEANEDVFLKNLHDGEWEKLMKDRLHNSTANVTTTTINPDFLGYSTSPNVYGRGGMQRVLEETEKSLMRQRFMMKKLGFPVNMTTLKKRFLHHWPVEESWSLDRYNKDYK